MENEKKIISPLIGYATQSGGSANGKGKEVLHFYHPVPDKRLWGHVIPKEADAEVYIDNYIKVLDCSEKQQLIECAKTEIIPVIGNKNKQITGSGKIANFEIFPLRKICYIDRSGINIAEKERILCKLVFDGGREEQMEILTSEISKLTKRITEKYSNAIINFTEPNAEKILEANFRFRTQTIPITRRLFEAGWQVVNGVHQYVNDSLVLLPDYEIETGVNLPFYNNLTPCEVGDIFIHATQLIKEKRTAYPVFLYSLMGVLFKLFEEAGYTPHFLLFLNGKTGSMKTTIAQILFAQLADMKHRNKPRRIDADTLVSFERAIVLSGRDTTLLIDDYAPAKTAQKKVDMQNRLEMIIRMVGDGATKSRSNAKLEDVQGEGVKGMVVVTGEISGKGVSSNLRCLYCEMKRNYANVECISWFQQRENLYAYTTAIMHFVEYISWNWERIVEYIIQRFPIERKEISNYIHEKRLVDSSVYLRITADVFERFMIDSCQADQLFITEMIKDMRAEIIANACVNEAMVKEEAYSQIFVKGIHTLMITNKVKLYNGKMEAEHVSVYDGFEDAEYYFFIPESIYIKVMEFLGRSRQYVPYDLKELVTSMYEDGIIQAHSNGYGKKTYYARINIHGGGKQRFLKISKRIFSEIIEGTFDDEKEGGFWYE